MSGQSPLKAKPLRLPGESVEIVRLRENALMDHLFVAACVFLLAFMESREVMFRDTAQSSGRGVNPSMGRTHTFDGHTGKVCPRLARSRKRCAMLRTKLS
jgi:hypothetical protein